jgi:hypothetical protein
MYGLRFGLYSPFRGPGHGLNMMGLGICFKNLYEDEAGEDCMGGMGGARLDLWLLIVLMNALGHLRSGYVEEHLPRV